jgi:CRP/FNR family transcriptional regulator
MQRRTVSPDFLPEDLRRATRLIVPPGEAVFSQGQSPANYLLVTAGSVKVFARSSEGRELVLYRVLPGEMCTLTTACLIGHSRYPAEAVTELETEVHALPATEFDQLLNESEPFRRYVFAGFSQRLAEVMQRLEQLVLESVHQRLAECLARLSDADGVVRATHEILAQEIGTAREVVSRHLKAMEQKCLIRILRGRIEIVCPDGLFRSN